MVMKKTWALWSALLFWPCLASAQNFPTKSVRIIVPFAPGGSTDIVARLLAPRLAENLGQQVIIDNRGGGAATIGTDMVAKATPDGHTLGMATLTFALNPSLFSKLPYNPERDFTPVSFVSTVPFVRRYTRQCPRAPSSNWWRWPRPNPAALIFHHRATAAHRRWRWN